MKYETYKEEYYTGEKLREMEELIISQHLATYDDVNNFLADRIVIGDDSGDIDAYTAYGALFGECEKEGAMEAFELICEFIGLPEFEKIYYTDNAGEESYIAFADGKYYSPYISSICKDKGEEYINTLLNKIASDNVQKDDD